MNKETMINILSQHGVDVLYDVISDTVNDSYEKGFEDGEHVGWCECYDMLSDDY